MTVSPSAVAGPRRLLAGRRSTSTPTTADLPRLLEDRQRDDQDRRCWTEPLEGEVVLATQKDNPFGSTFAIYLVDQGPRLLPQAPGGTQRRQADRPDEDGLRRPTRSCPSRNVHLDFRGGPTAPLVTPNTCGTYTTHTDITSWASPDPVVHRGADDDRRKLRPAGVSSNPTLQAGVANPVAGAISPLTIRVSRQDGEQNISRDRRHPARGRAGEAHGRGSLPRRPRRHRQLPAKQARSASPPRRSAPEPSRSSSPSRARTRPPSTWPAPTKAPPTR